MPARTRNKLLPSSPTSPHAESTDKKTSAARTSPPNVTLTIAERDAIDGAMHRIRTLARLGRQLVDIDDDDHDVVVFGGAELFEVVEETVEEIELALGAADERRIGGAR
jgi:hypothetical protein